MPKIRIIGKYNNVRIFDGKKEMHSSGVKVAFSPQEIIVRIPLKILGNPDFILSSFRISLGRKESASLFYTSGFRKINLNYN